MRRGSLYVSSIWLAAVLVAVSLLSGGHVTRAAAPSHILVVGTPISLTGATAHEGHLVLEGYKIWLREVNAAGGIKVGKGRYRVQFKYYDDGSDPARSAELTTRLITKDRVNFLLGPFGTAPTLQNSIVAEQHRVLMVEGTGAARSIFSRGNHYVFGVISPADKYARIMLQAALSVPDPPRSVAIIYASDAFSQEVAAAAHTYALSHGLKVVTYEQYPANATDLTGILTQVKNAHPDMLLGSGHQNESEAAIKESKRLGINAKLYAFTVGPAIPDFITNLGSAANDVIGSAQWTAQEKYRGVDYFQTPIRYQHLYVKMFGHRPAYQAAGATAAGVALQYAITKAGSINQARVRKALVKLNIPTFFGRIRFDASGINSYKPMAVVQIQHGQLATVYPRNIANRPLIYPAPEFNGR